MSPSQIRKLCDGVSVTGEEAGWVAFRSGLGNAAQGFQFSARHVYEEVLSRC
jgi:hypothetical protein